MKQYGMETEQVTQGRHSRARNGTPSLLTATAKVRSLQVASVWEILCDAEGAWSQRTSENL